MGALFLYVVASDACVEHCEVPLVLQRPGPPSPRWVPLLAPLRVCVDPWPRAPCTVKPGEPAGPAPRALAWCSRLLLPGQRPRRFWSRAEGGRSACGAAIAGPAHSLCAGHPTICAKPHFLLGATPWVGVPTPTSSLRCPLFLLNKGFRFRGGMLPYLGRPPSWLRSAVPVVQDCRDLAPLSGLLVLTPRLPLA